MAAHYPPGFTVYDIVRVTGGHIIETQHNISPAPDNGPYNDATAGLRMAHARPARKARVR
jgi:hypothetical protein